ncbi:hypothetical protein DL770_007826 [Monosporascus sp. CRB-9-2]|nr:hypothetical protein DL770_007826 [Monosporascus sp. CRB-9-2]
MSSSSTTRKAFGLLVDAAVPHDILDGSESAVGEAPGNTNILRQRQAGADTDGGKDIQVAGTSGRRPIPSVARARSLHTENGAAELDDILKIVSIGLSVGRTNNQFLVNDEISDIPERLLQRREVGTGQGIEGAALRAIDERRSHSTLISLRLTAAHGSINVHVQRSGSVAVEEPSLIVDVSIGDEALMRIQRRFTTRKSFPGKGEIAAVLLDDGTPVFKVKSEFIELGTSADMRAPVHRPVDITTAETLVVVGGIGIAIRNRHCEVLLGIRNAVRGDILVGVLVAVKTLTYLACVGVGRVSYITDCQHVRYLAERMVKSYLYVVEHFVLSPVRFVMKIVNKDARPHFGVRTRRLLQPVVKGKTTGNTYGRRSGL